MATREQIFDYSIAEELPDGTVRYWMEDQWRAVHGDDDFWESGRKTCLRRQLKTALVAAGKITWPTLKAIAILSWHVLRLTWKVFWFLIVVFCLQSLVGIAIALSSR